MTVGILQAMQLRDTMRKRLKTAGGSAAARRAALAGLPAEFHQQLPAVLDFPWTLATGASTEPPSATKQCPEALPWSLSLVTPIACIMASTPPAPDVSQPAAAWLQAELLLFSRAQ